MPTPTQKDPMSGPQHRPKTRPYTQPRFRPRTDPNQHSPPGPEPQTLSANIGHRARLDSACSGVSAASSRAGPKDNGDRARLSEQARQARRNKKRKKRKLKRQEYPAGRREDEDEEQLAGAKSKLVDDAVSQPVCSGKPTNNNNKKTHPSTPAACDPPVRATVR